MNLCLLRQLASQHARNTQSLRRSSLVVWSAQKKEEGDKGEIKIPITNSERRLKSTWNASRELNLTTAELAQSASTYHQTSMRQWCTTCTRQITLIMEHLTLSNFQCSRSSISNSIIQKRTSVDLVVHIIKVLTSRKLCLEVTMNAILQKRWQFAR